MTNIKKKPVVLILADGFGLNPNWHGNAIAAAAPEHFDEYWRNYRHLVIQSDRSSSKNPYETYTELATGQPFANQSCEARLSQEILANDNQFLSSLDSLKRNDAALHLFIEVSSQNQNDSLSDLTEVMKCAKKNSVLNTFVHIFIADAVESVAEVDNFLSQIEKVLSEIEYGQIATITGCSQIAKHGTKQTLRLLYSGKGQTFLSVRQALLATKSSKPAETDPTIIKSRQSQKINNFDLLFFSTSLSEAVSSLLREMILLNKEKTSSFHPSFLDFYAIKEFSFDFRDEVKYLFCKRTENYLSDLLHRKEISQAIVTDRQNLNNINFYFLGQSKNVDQYVVESSDDSSTKQINSTTAKITTESLALIAKKKCDFLVINFPSLPRISQGLSFKDSVREVKLLDECLYKIVEAVKSDNGFVLFCPTFGFAESITENKSSKEIFSSKKKAIALPFIIISANTKLKSDENLLHEIIRARADLTKVYKALKIILLADESDE